MYIIYKIKEFHLSKVLKLNYIIIQLKIVILNMVLFILMMRVTQAETIQLIIQPFLMLNQNMEQLYL